VARGSEPQLAAAVIDGRTAAGRPAVTTPVPRAAWESVLSLDTDALVTQSLPWRDALFAGGRYRDVSRLYEFRSGQRVLIPLACHRLQVGPGQLVSSWPHVWGVGGPLTATPAVTLSEAAAVLDDLASLGSLSTVLHVPYNADDAWLTASDRFKATASNSWLLSLAGGADEVWQRRFRSSVRRAIRKAERASLEIEVDHSGQLLDTFYLLYEKSVQRWAEMQHAPTWLTRRRLASTINPDRLRRVAESFGKDCLTWVARLDGEPVASLVVLYSGKSAKAWCAAMDKSLAAPLGGVNQLLDWCAVQDACSRDCRYYDLGYATPGTSLGDYKKWLGADLVFHHELRSERLPLQAAGELPKRITKKIIGFRDNL
jgi:Acetyltransferase (GNAT) domain